MVVVCLAFVMMLCLFCDCCLFVFCYDAVFYCGCCLFYCLSLINLTVFSSVRR